MLKINKLTKTYDGGVQALNGVSLSLDTGLFGLLGPNGAGKSSLMRTLATLQEADSGSAELDGIDVLRDKDKVRRVLGYLPQDFGLYPQVDAETMLDHFADLKGLGDRRRRAAEVRRLLELTNLWDVRKRKLGTYSGGMRQRFGIAQALIGEPRLIIVDEPTNGLDPEERRRFLNLLAGLGEKAVVILSTHLVADVRELCRAMAVIRRGEVLVTGRPETLVAQLEGRVWRRELRPGDENAPGLLSTHLEGGRPVGRFSSREPMGPGFEAVAPNLEDVYFAALR